MEGPTLGAEVVRMDRWSNWYDDGDEIQGAQAPPCPRCGQRLRKPDTWRDPMLRGVARPPWNAGWDGRCEHCGESIEHVISTMGTYQVSEDGYAAVSIGAPAPPATEPDSLVGSPDLRPAEQRLLPHGPRRTVRLRSANIPVRTFIDEGRVFAGVEIVVSTTQYGEAEPTEERVRLSLGELAQLHQALEGPLRALTEQWSWSVDDT